MNERQPLWPMHLSEEDKAELLRRHERLSPDDYRKLYLCDWPIPDEREPGR